MDLATIIGLLLAAALIGANGGSIRFAKGSVAAMRFHGVPEIGNAELRWLVTARMPAGVPSSTGIDIRPSLAIRPMSRDGTSPKYFGNCGA